MSVSVDVFCGGGKRKPYLQNDQLSFSDRPPTRGTIGVESHNGGEFGEILFAVF